MMEDETKDIAVPVDAAHEQKLIEEARRQMGHVTPAPPGVGPGVPARPLLGGAYPGYDIVREIHRGGQGVVYLAIQKATKRRVALKVMHPGSVAGSAGKTRFDREVQILGQLQHPNIVQIHDSGSTPEGGLFYVMDYISGHSLDELMESPDRPSVEQTLRLFAKICEGVSAAHLRGVIHRDLKPSNIRVTPAGEPVIVDFGLAKVAAGELTEEPQPQLMSMTGQFIGSLPWASPEQAEGSPGAIDVRTDVYSLGVILYQMLTGKFPYEVVGNIRDVMDNILRAEPARPSTIRRQINDEVETIVLKCLSKERERRYQSAGELARDIRHYLAGEPIEAKRDSGWYVLTKTLRRYRGVALTGAAFLVLIVVFGIAMTVLWDRERAAKAEARQLAIDKGLEAERAQRAEGVANEQKSIAQAEATKANRVRELIERVLENARPAVARGRDVLVTDVLDAFSAQVEPELAAEPEVAVEIHSVIGATYLNLLALEKARVHLDRALALRRQLSGPDAPETLEAINNVGIRLRNSAQYVPAEALFREVLAGYTAKAEFGPESEEALGTMINLARTIEVMRDDAKKAEAAQLYERVIEIATRTLAQGGERPAILNITRTHYGNFLIGKQEFERAEGLLRDSLRDQLAAPDGANDPNAAKTRLRLAQVLDRRGADAAEVRATFEQAILDMRRILKDTHPDTLASRAVYARYLAAHEELARAAEDYADVVRAALAGALPAGHPNIALYRGDYGEMLTRLQRYPEAEAELKAALEGVTAAGAPQTSIDKARARLLDLYTRWGKPEEAEKFKPGG